MSDHDYMSVLRHEFFLDYDDSEESYEEHNDTFLHQLRGDFYWDRRRFEILTDALRTYGERHKNDETIPRWLADNVWYLYSFVPSFTSHPGYPRPYDPAYYEWAYRILEDLAGFLFSGLGAGFEPFEPRPTQATLGGIFSDSEHNDVQSRGGDDPNDCSEDLP